MKTTSCTDWTRFDALTDEEIDTSDIPPLDEEFFARDAAPATSTGHHHAAS